MDFTDNNKRAIKVLDNKERLLLMAVRRGLIIILNAIEDALDTPKRRRRIPK